MSHAASSSSPGPLLFRNYYSAIGRIGILALVAMLNTTAIIFIMVGIVALLQYLATPKRQIA